MSRTTTEQESGEKIDTSKRTAGHVLVVDDEPSLCELLEFVLEKDGHTVETARTAEQARKKFEESDFDVVLQDIKMEDASGLDLLQEYSSKNDTCQVIIITAYSTWDSAVEAMREGAFDYFSKPFDNEEIRTGVRHAIESGNYNPEDRTADRPLFKNLVGDSQPIKEVRRTLNRVAPTNVTVLICGESGTGKELVARTVHFLSTRRDQPFMSVNCGAFPKNLLESELFGHVEGAFTGAKHDKQGILEVASGGTLFLDEIAEMPEEMQVKLLRVLEEQEFKPVGGVEKRSVDLRFIAATNKNLEQQVQQGNFREDLYFRLNVVNVNVPPLRKRGDDIFLLAGHFLNENARQAGKEIKGFSDSAQQKLRNYPWPGNVRELENAVQRAVALTESDVIQADLLFQDTGQLEKDQGIQLPEDGMNLEDKMEEIEIKYIKQALERSGGNIKEAANSLDLSYRSLRYKLDKYEIQPED